MNYRLFFSAVAMTLLLSTACVQKDRVVEYPLIESANTMTLDFSKVELTDTATILHTDAYYRPNYWIRIDSKSYLKANGKKYALKGTQGIEADSLFWMPDSGEASFTLLFEPMPKNTKKFDFIESDCDDCFKLFGIDLTGKKMYDEPKGVPADLLKVDGNTSVPEPVFRVGETTVNVHFLGYRKEFGKEANLYVNTMFGNQQSYTALIDTLTGTATFTFEQYGPAQSFIMLGLVAGDAWLVPGEPIDLYVDMRVSGWNILYRRRNKGKATVIPSLPKVYASGTYHNMTNIYARRGTRPMFVMDIHNRAFADYRISAEEYTRNVIKMYQSLSDSIAQADLFPLEKEIQQISLKQDAFVAMVAGDRIREYNYRRANNKWNRQDKVEGIDLLKPEHYSQVTQLFDINDPKLMLGLNYFDYIGSLVSPTLDWSAITGTTDGLIADLRKVIQLPAKAENVALTETDIQMLKEMKNPFYLEAFEAMQANAQKKLAEVESMARIEKTPDVPNEKLFDAMIAPYKGKVILVDFWNTWCGPCRAALKANEPLKETELKNDQLVWMYIANETSPLVKYKSMIPEIQGIHFRLNDKQWAYLCEKFKIDGIPSYVLVDKDGKYGLRNDFRNHELMKNTLKDMIH